MNPLRWSLALLAALSLSACKRDEPAPATAPKVGAEASKAQGTAKHGATGVGATAPVPARASHALAYLKPVDPGRCEWVRQPLPTGEATTVFAFNAACDSSMVAWNPSGREGLVFTWPSAEGEVPRAWRVDLGARSGWPLDLKGLPGGSSAGGQDQPYIEQLGFDAQGRPLALIADVYIARPVQEGEKGSPFILFEGKRYELPAVDGAPGLAHAYRHEAGGWKRIETKGSQFESDIAPGTRELETAREMRPVFKAHPSPRMSGQEASEDAAKKLDAAFPGQEESGQWMTLTTPGGALHFRGTLGGEYLYPAPPVRWEQEDKLVELEGLAAEAGDSLDLSMKEDWLLIARYGDARSAQVWDTRTKKLLVTAKEAYASTFWPTP